jgi:hypothetical protein
MHHRQSQGRLALSDDIHIDLGGERLAGVDALVQPFEGSIAVAHRLLDALLAGEIRGLTVRLLERRNLLGGQFAYLLLIAQPEHP